MQGDWASQEVQLLAHAVVQKWKNHPYLGSNDQNFRMKKACYWGHSHAGLNVPHCGDRVGLRALEGLRHDHDLVVGVTEGHSRLSCLKVECQDGVVPGHGHRARHGLHDLHDHEELIRH